LIERTQVKPSNWVTTNQFSIIRHLNTHKR
jgi:hypothetical protein